MKVAVRIKKLVEGAKIPKYETKGAAGFDLCSVEGGVLMNGQTMLVKTGLAVAIPDGYEIQVRPRSGLALKSQLTVLNSPGTVDSDYRGEIGVILTNLGSKAFEFKAGERIAQGVLMEVPQAVFIEVDELDETDRGTGGFGSTGVMSSGMTSGMMSGMKLDTPPVHASGVIVMGEKPFSIARETAQEVAKVIAKNIYRESGRNNP